MDDTTLERSNSAPEAYEPPAYEVLSLGCEISAYAPDDGDLPLF